MLLVLLAALMGAAALGSVMVQRSSGADYRTAKATYAAEAGADHVMAQLNADVRDGVITDAELAALTAPTIPDFGLTVNAVRVGASQSRPISSGPYTGLIGLNQRIDMTVTATDALQDRSDVVLSANAQSIPLFQFGVFFEEDLEITNGPPMVFGGWVHSNGKIYLSSNNQHFQDVISTPDSLVWQRKDKDLRLTGTWIDNAAGDSINLTFDSRAPGPLGFVGQSQQSFDGRVRTGESGVVPLRLPLPVGMSPTELVAPRNAGDTPELQTVKLSWLADWQITVNMAGGLAADPCGAGQIVPLPRPGGKQVPTTIPECQAIFTGSPDAFLEGREDSRPDLLQINVAALHAWVNANPANRQNSILYVTFNTAGCSVTTCDYPAIRLVNGSSLQFPWTIATDRPAYILGNYNNAGVWRPAAVLADAVTFQSNGWTDAANDALGEVTATSGEPQVPQELWIYAAIAAGHSATPCDWVDLGCTPSGAFPNPPLSPSTANYGGGLENFPRFLENWGGSATGTFVHYRGSLVSLFESQYARRYRWGWRDYYVPPRRDWQFDTRFRDPTQLPPGTPAAGNVIQIAFRPVYR
jgi:hypothetical protein